jgi:hypothetical protein
MKVIDLEGNKTTWNLHGHNTSVHKSSYHLLTRDLLVKLYPTLVILEEVPVVLRRSQTVFLDFYLPLRKMAIEVQGEQHFKYIPHFHHTLAAFAKARKRDEEKKEWCELNNITLIEFPYNESVEEWKAKLI